MYRPILVVIALVIVVVPASAAPITFDFNATSCINLANGTPCGLDPAVPIATLTLPSSTSTGSGDWDGVNPPVYTGDSFTLTYNSFVVPPANISPDPGCVAGRICFFDISWNEVNSQLTSVSISVHGLNDDIGFGGPAGTNPFGLTGGSIASDGHYNGCIDTQCVVTGSWVPTSSLPTPEPATALLLIIPLALVVLRVTSSSSRWG